MSLLRLQSTCVIKSPLPAWAMTQKNWIGWVPLPPAGHITSLPLVIVYCLLTLGEGPPETCKFQELPVPWKFCLLLALLPESWSFPPHFWGGNASILNKFTTRGRSLEGILFKGVWKLEKLREREMGKAGKRRKTYPANTVTAWKERADMHDQCVLGPAQQQRNLECGHAQ